MGAYLCSALLQVTEPLWNEDEVYRFLMGFYGHSFGKSWLGEASNTVKGMYQKSRYRASLCTTACKGFEAH